VLELDVFSYFYDHGFPVESIEEAHAVVNEKAEKENTAHLVVKIETLRKPLDIADLAIDGGFKMFACDCRAYQFHHSVDLEDKNITNWGECKHIDEVKSAKT